MTSRREALGAICWELDSVASPVTNLTTGSVSPDGSRSGWTIYNEAVSDQVFTFTAETSLREVDADQLLGMVRTLLEGFGGVDQWSVRKITMSSPLTIECRPKVGEAERLARVTHERFKKLAAGMKVRKVQSDSLQSALNAVATVTEGPFGVITITPKGGKCVRVDHETATIAGGEVRTRKLPPLDRCEFGEVRGYFEKVSAPKNQPPVFSIRDKLTGRLITCKIAADRHDLFERAKKALRGEAKVTGMLRLGADGHPQSIKVETVDPIVRHVIPIREWQGVDVTGGEDSVKYIRRLRDA